MKQLRTQTILLLAASYIFYMWWNPAFILLIVFSTGVDFVVGRAIHATDRERRRRSLLLISLVSNLGLLGIFKYLDFFIICLNQVVHWAGAGLEIPLMRLLLPVGISFYTFQSMSYTIDIYRREIEPEPSFLRFALFVAFFPQLVAGPILRAAQFLPQLRQAVSLRAVNLRSGFHLVAVGFVKKVLIADNVAPLVEAILNDPAGMASSTIWVGTIAFAIQLYCDFSGYTDIARGLGTMMGFRIPENFNFPFLARSITEFWQRWHITLTTWLRDYVFRPIFDRRKGRRRFLWAIFVTMFLCGLWHGAAINFVMFGLYIALIQVLETRFGFRTRVGSGSHPSPRHKPFFEIARVKGFIRWAVNMVLVLYGFVLFRVHGLPNLLIATRKFLFLDAGAGAAAGVRLPALHPYLELFCVAAFLVLHVLSYRRGGWQNLLDRSSVPARTALYVILGFLSVFFWPAARQSYIYFQF